MNKTIFFTVVLVAFACLALAKMPESNLDKLPDSAAKKFFPSKLACKDCDESCPTNDCITHNIAQTPCVVETKKASWDCRWPYYGLASHTDQVCIDFSNRIV